jgi:hypothetical protein
VTTYRVTKIGIAKPGRKRKVKTRSPRKTGVRKVNRERRKSEFSRCYGSAERVEFVRGLPCVICKRVGLSENAHVVSGGVSRKADAGKIVPLCSSTFERTGHHAILHQIGAATFEQLYGIGLEKAAALTQRRWLSHLESTNG